MSSNPHPLQALVGPLRFASARDFANLKTVKQLAPPLVSAIARARGSVPTEIVSGLERELPEIGRASCRERV